MAALFPDNTVLINFACIDRLDLLEGWLRGRGRWTEAVHYEAQQSAAYHPALNSLLTAAWLGEPVSPDDQAAKTIEKIRRSVFGGTTREPLKHLGEAQTCYLLQKDSSWADSWWVTDDRDAREYARRQHLIVRQTIDVFRNIVSDGDLDAAMAFQLMHDIDSRDRHLELPRTLTTSSENHGDLPLPNLGYFAP